VYIPLVLSNVYRTAYRQHAEPASPAVEHWLAEYMVAAKRDDCHCFRHAELLVQSASRTKADYERFASQTSPTLMVEIAVCM